MSELSTRLAADAWASFGGDPELARTALSFRGEGALPSSFAVTDIAAASAATAALAVSELLGGDKVVVDRRLTSFWFGWSLRPVGWSRPHEWDAVSGDYRTKDGWIRIHANAPAHRIAMMKVLGAGGAREDFEPRVAQWTGLDLETAIVEAGGASAQMRSAAAWDQHPQGMAVAAEPLVDIGHFDQVADPAWRAGTDRPLQGLKVLDLTRILAGPIATRFLAGYGAEVLRLDPADWDEPGIVPEITLGKRCARIDLKTAEGKATLEKLLSEADVLLHGYRPEALERLGFGAERRREIRPDLVDVTLDAYGWTGPWARRRGFDSLVQMSAGCCEAEMRWAETDRPKSLPVSVHDHACGYFLAAAAVRGVTRRARGEGGSSSRLSLARTCRFLVDAGPRPDEPLLAPETLEDIDPAIEETHWGPAHRIRAPFKVGATDWRWDRPAPDLGTSEAVWP